MSMTATLVYANKAFGFTPEYTLWDLSWQMLQGMFSEHYYYNVAIRNDYKTDKNKKPEGEAALASIPGVIYSKNGDN